jgi:hypothetical protein
MPDSQRVDFAYVSIPATHPSRQLSPGRRQILPMLVTRGPML